MDLLADRKNRHRLKRKAHCKALRKRYRDELEVEHTRLSKKKNRPIIEQPKPTKRNRGFIARILGKSEK